MTHDYWKEQDQLRGLAEWNGNAPFDPKPHCYEPESSPVRMLGGLILLAMAMAVLGIIAGVSIFLSGR
jgi:hypothetical protein